MSLSHELDPPTENKRLILEQEMVAWRGSLYQARTRYRVRELIGDSSEALKTSEADMARCLKALDYLATILQELDAEEQTARIAMEQQAVEALAQRNGHKEPATEQG